MELICIIFEVLVHLVRYGTVEMTAVVILSVVYLLLPGNEQLGFFLTCVETEYDFMRELG